MEDHEVKTIRVMEHAIFKNVPVDYEANYFIVNYKNIALKRNLRYDVL
jgi:hypothetical protein